MERATLESTEQNMSEYLHSGEQTVITEQIKKIGETIEGAFEDKVMQIFSYLKKLKYQPANKGFVIRRRTADQIISDGYVTGCTDEALVFIALARAAGIPSKYIETIDMEWMNSGGERMGGHIYAGVFDSGDWRIADPSGRRLDVSINEDGRIIFAEGLDSWDIGIRDANSLEQKFNQFRAAQNIKA